MYFNDLPDDITLMVLENCMDKSADLHVWKNSLVYLKVCRQWSKLAVPIVYRNVVVNVGVSPITQTECAERVVSNASIVVSRNTQHVVKHVHVEIDYLQHPFYKLMAALEMLNENNVWKNVCTLTIELDRMDHDESMHLQYLPPAELEPKISETVFRLLPSLENISLANTDDNVFICSMYSNLVQNYFPKICSLASQHPLRFSMQQLPNTLTWLDITLQDDVHKYIPQVCAGSLKFLRMTNVPQNYMWDCFGMHMCIEFDCLETLHIEYQYNISDQPMDIKCCTPSTFRMRFFKLQSLYISECSGHCCLLECSMFMVPLQTVDVQGSSNAVRALSHMRMPKIQVLKLGVNRLESTTGSELTAHMARVFKNASAQKTEFYATAKYVHFDTNLLSCPSLSSISIHMPTDAAWLIELIKKFTCLEYVALENMVFNNIPKEACNVRSGKYITEYLEPVDTRIYYMRLKHSSDFYTVREARVFMQYVVLLVPSLQVLATVVDTIHEICDVVNDYMPFYPHLRNIEFCNVNDE
ncbi:hypothetical protein H4S00_000701 [Coemansia sp. D1744]|nr:hypothetical protein H4S00_000701 [Coemansia sp. D1744]